MSELVSRWVGWQGSSLDRSVLPHERGLCLPQVRHQSLGCRQSWIGSRAHLRVLDSALKTYLLRNPFLLVLCVVVCLERRLVLLSAALCLHGVVFWVVGGGDVTAFVPGVSGVKSLRD